MKTQNCLESEIVSSNSSTNHHATPTALRLGIYLSIQLALSDTQHELRELDNKISFANLENVCGSVMFCCDAINCC